MNLMNLLQFEIFICSNFVYYISQNICLYQHTVNILSLSESIIKLMYIHCTTKNTEKGKIINLLPRYVVLINTGLTSSFVSCPVYKSTDHNIAEILLKGVLHTINQTKPKMFIIIFNSNLSKICDEIKCFPDLMLF